MKLPEKDTNSKYSLPKASQEEEMLKKQWQDTAAQLQKPTHKQRRTASEELTSNIQKNLPPKMKTFK